jgi:acyl carrier protein
MPETLETQIREFIIRKFPSARSRELTRMEALLENGIIDSLGVLDLVSFMEETFAITVTDEELLPENFQTIERLAKFVEGKRNGKMQS